MSRLMAALRLGLGVLRQEGLSGARDRWLDRLAIRRRRRAYTDAGDLALNDAFSNTRVSLPRVSVLNVLSTAPRPDLGGVQTQLLRRLAAESRRRALLSMDGGGYRLEIDAEGQRLCLTSNAEPPAAPPALRDPELEAVMALASRRISAQVVHFEQLAGLPLESVLRLADGSVSGPAPKVVVSAHDFVLFCPRPHLVERPAERFCAYSRDPARCHACLSQSWPVEQTFQARRRDLAAELLCRAAAVIYPSDFLRRTYAELFPGLNGARQHVVEPPSVASMPLPSGSDVAVKAPVRHLAYVGSVKAHKGAHLLEALLERFPPGRVPGLRWSVFGGGDREVLVRLRRRPDVRVRGYYRSGALPGLLRREGIDLALLLSIWPESYALTFDECSQAGVPALALDHGAVGDRVREYGGGVAVDPRAGVEGVVAALRELLDGEVSPPASSRAMTALPTGESAATAILEIYKRLVDDA